MKLHLPCGFNRLPGWHNVDAAEVPSDEVVDLSGPLPWPDDSADCIYSEHFIEHLTDSAQDGFLRECFRVLRPGGVLRIACPDLRDLCERYLAGDLHLTSWAISRRHASACSAFNDALRESGLHLFVIDGDNLKRKMLAAGFGDVRRHPYRSSRHPAMQGIDARPEDQDTLVMEGGKVEPTITTITPTQGRETLARMMRSISMQDALGSGDRALIVDDGSHPDVRALVESMGHPFVYMPTDGPSDRGNPQRNVGVAAAEGDYLTFVDDDNIMVQGALGLIRAAVRAYPGRPLLFRHLQPGGVVWKQQAAAVGLGDIDGHCFVAPNLKSILGRWSSRYESDFDFIQSTLVRWRPDAYVWVDHVVCHAWPAGPTWADPRADL